MEPGPRTAPADLILLLVPVVWGLNFIVIKGALGEFASPQSFNALRWILATGVLAVAVAFRRDRFQFAHHDWIRILLIAGLGNVLQQLTFINGIRLTTAGHAALLMGLAPAMVAVANAGLGLEHVMPRTWAGIVLSVVGLTVLAPPPAAPARPEALVGDLLILASAACWALYSLATRRLALLYSPTAITAVTMAIATAILIVIGLPALLEQPGDWRSAGSGLHEPRC